MPHGCIYPQDTTVNEFLDDGTPNPYRCPYRTHWKPYKTSANNLCCKTQFVRNDDRAIKIMTDVPATRAQQERLGRQDHRSDQDHVAERPGGAAHQRLLGAAVLGVHGAVRGPRVDTRPTAGGVRWRHRPLGIS